MKIAVAPKRTARRERVLIDFPSDLLKRTDLTAAKVKKNRSDLIRSAVEHFLMEIDKQDFEAKLAAAYHENAQISRELGEEFSFVDREGL